MTDSAPEAKSMIFSWLGSCIPSNNDSKTKVTYEGFTLNGVTFNIGDCVLLSPEADTLPYIGRIQGCWEDSFSNTGSSHNIEVKWFERRVNLDDESKGVQESEKEVLELEGNDVNPIGCISAKCLVVRAVSFAEAESKMNGRVSYGHEWFFSRGYFIQATNTFKPYTSLELSYQQGLPPTLIPSANAHTPPTSLLNSNSLRIPALASMTSAEVEAAVSGMLLAGAGSSMDFDLQGVIQQGVIQQGGLGGSLPSSSLPPMFLPLNLQQGDDHQPSFNQMISSMTGGTAAPSTTWPSMGLHTNGGQARGGASASFWPPGFGITEESNEEQDPSSGMGGGNASGGQRERPQALSKAQQQQGAKRPATGRVCVECGATQTPQWREGPAGPKTLCNACGVRHVRALQKMQNGGGGKKPPKPGGGGGGGGGGGRYLGSSTQGGAGGYSEGTGGGGLSSLPYDIPYGGGGGGGGGANGSVSHRSYDNASSGESEEAGNVVSNNLLNGPGPGPGYSTILPAPRSSSHVNPSSTWPPPPPTGPLDLFEPPKSRTHPHHPPLGSSPLSSSTQGPIFAPFPPTTLPLLPLSGLEGLEESQHVDLSPQPRSVAAAAAAAEEAARAAHLAALASSKSPPQVSLLPSGKPISPQLESAKKLVEKASIEAAAADAALHAVQEIFQARSRAADKKRREVEEAGKKLRNFVHFISSTPSTSNGGGEGLGSATPLFTAI